jgi:hypothetical protein
MRKGLARILIALSVALLVPLQGLAAAQGDLCVGIGHHGHDAGGGAKHDHGGNDDGKAAAHCTPCVACCAAAAIAPAVTLLTPDQRAGAQVGASPPLLSGIQPETLDRPPLVL